MREIKFRMYYKDKLIEELTLEEIADKCEFHWDSERVKVCQYIGRKDRTGREIYEGDLLQGCLSRVLEVVWGKFGWRIRFKDLGQTITEDMDRELFYNYEPVVIGNIYENPELIA